MSRQPVLICNIKEMLTMNNDVSNLFKISILAINYLSTFKKPLFFHALTYGCYNGFEFGFLSISMYLIVQLLKIRV